MTNNEMPTLLLACAAGAALGGVFFGGLWWTVKKGVSSKHPALWFTGSFLLRMSIAMAGLQLVSGGHWQRLLSCLLGFVVAHPVVTWLSRSSAEDQTRRAQRASHAPQSR